jgi:hypothetical protein
VAQREPVQQGEHQNAEKGVKKIENRSAHRQGEEEELPPAPISVSGAFNGRKTGLSLRSMFRDLAGE